MAMIFLKLLNMSIAASWLIAAVIVLRFILKRAPKWIMPVLWGIAGIRLVLPVSLQSRFSLIPSAEPLPQTMLNSNTFRVDSGIVSVDSAMNHYLGSHYYEGVSVSAGYGSRRIMILGLIWAVGVSFLVIYGLVSYFKLKRNVKESIPLKDNIRICDHVKSPFIFGIQRPAIYLSSAISEADLKFVIAHEQAHLKRRDHWWKLLGYLFLCVYWFNPLVWIAYILLCKDIELACDEKVIRDLDMGEKKAYAAALVDCSMQKRMIMVCPLSFGEVDVKERVNSVLNYKKPASWVMITAIAVCLLLSVCFLTNPEQKKDGNINVSDTSEAPETYHADDTKDKQTDSGFIQRRPYLASWGTTSDENMGIDYVKTSDGSYIVDGDMVFRYKKELIGRSPNAACDGKFIVLTNNPDITFEEVDRSLYSSSSTDWLTDTIIIGVNVLIDSE